jgi:ABC-type glucose/galactose transport system permease subunit
MPVIFAANESVVQVDNKPLDGVLSIDYRFTQARANIYALGSAERIATVSGPQAVEGILRVASTSEVLNAKTGDATFQIMATFKHGKQSMDVSFDECYLTGKSFELGVGGNGEAVYTFSAIRVREDPPKG